MNSKPILCLDFDGTINSYISGWQGAEVVGDPPVDGAMKFIDDAMDWFTVAIYSSRSDQEGGIDAMKRYIHTHMKAYIGTMRDDLGEQYANDVIAELKWPTSKPPAFLTIDDRALTFNGFWPDPEQLRKFTPWNKRDNIYDTIVAGKLQFSMVAPRDVNRDVPDGVVDHWAEQLIVMLRDVRDADGKRIAIKIPVTSAILMAQALGRANGDRVAYAGALADNKPELPFHTRTKGGKPVRILAIDARRSRPVIGIVEEGDGTDSIGQWYRNGSWWQVPLSSGINEGLRTEAMRNDLAELPPSLREEGLSRD